MTSRVRGDKVESNQAGIIQLGQDRKGELQVMDAGDAEIEFVNNARQEELLQSIDQSLKTLLSYMEEIVGDKI